MNTQNQALSVSAELQQLADLKMDREICPRGRFVIAMMTACEIDTHCTEMLAHLRSQMGITFVGSDFAVLSFSGTRTDPEQGAFTPIWTALVSPLYLRLRSIILSVVNLRHVGLTCEAGGRIYCVVNFTAQTSDFYQEIRSLCIQVKFWCKHDAAFPSRFQSAHWKPEFLAQKHT